MRLDDRITRLEMHAEQLLIHYRSLPRASREARKAREKLRIIMLRLLNLRRHQREIAADMMPAEVTTAAAIKRVVQSTA